MKKYQMPIIEVNEHVAMQILMESTGEIQPATPGISPAPRNL